MREIENSEVSETDATRNEVISSPCSYTLTNEELAEIEITQPTYFSLISHLRISMGLIACIFS
jgi:hypothetical protein